MHHDYMTLIQIRGVADSTRDELKARAASEGLSLNAYLRRILERAVEVPPRDVVLARIGSRPGKNTRSSSQVVRDERDVRSAATPS